MFPFLSGLLHRQRLFVEHDLGESSGSTVDVVRRAGYPWPEQMARKMLRNVEKRGVHTARNGPGPPPTPAGGPVAKAEMSTADRLGSKGGVEPGRAPAGEGREPVGYVELAMTHPTGYRLVRQAFAARPRWVFRGYPFCDDLSCRGRRRLLGQLARSCSGHRLRTRP